MQKQTNKCDYTTKKKLLTLRTAEVEVMERK